MQGGGQTARGTGFVGKGREGGEVVVAHGPEYQPDAFQPPERGQAGDSARVSRGESVVHDVKIAAVRRAVVLMLPHPAEQDGQLQFASQFA